MALKYHVVKRSDLSKDAARGDVLYYGQVRAGDRVTLTELCESISALSTASEGDVLVVLEGLLMLMRQNLIKGHIVEFGDIGSFRMVAGSSGVEEEEDFHTSLFKKGKIVYVPGVRLKHLFHKVQYEKCQFVEKEIPCDRDHAV